MPSPFFTRPNFEDRQIVQYSSSTITLSGSTNIDNVGLLQINAPILDFTGTTSASTLYTIAGVSGYVNYGKPSSLKVEPPIIIQSGSTGTTTVDVTGYVLGGLDSEGHVTWAPPTPIPAFLGGLGVTVTLSAITYTVASNLPVLNNTYVSKSGSDTTGVSGRLDRPFLTISAATAAALVAYPVRTQEIRATIIVETGYYIDTIDLYDFIDYELNNSVIKATATKRTIDDGDRVFSITTNNVPNCIISGNATLINEQPFLSVVNITSNGIKVLLKCSSLSGLLFEAIIQRSGYLKVYTDTIYMDNALTNAFQCINLISSLTKNAPVLEVYNAKIYTNQSGSLNSVIEIFNGTNPLNTAYSKVMLVNCEVGSWSSTRAAINCTHQGGLSFGLAEITLKDTIIYTASQASIDEEFAIQPINVMNVWAYNCFVTIAPVITTGTIVSGTVSVSLGVRFNQGVVI